MPWETEIQEEGDKELKGPSGEDWPAISESPPTIPSGSVDKLVNGILPNMNQKLPDADELQTWTPETQFAFYEQRRKYWGRWNIDELRDSCLDRGLWPEGAQRFLKDRLIRYDYAKASLTDDELKAWEPPVEGEDNEEEPKQQVDDDDEEDDDPYR